MLTCCRSFQIGLITYLPLTSGFLTGKYQYSQPALVGSTTIIAALSWVIMNIIVSNYR